MDILLAFFVPFIGLLRAFKIKEWRERGVDTFATASACRFLAMFGCAITLIYILTQKIQFDFSFSWFTILFLWTITCFAAGSISWWFMKHVPITQLRSLIKAFNLIFYLIIDLFLFNINFNLGLIVGIILIFLGGISLSIKGATLSYFKANMWSSLSICSSVALLGVSSNGIYKYLTLHQTNLLFLAACSQLILCLIYLSFGLKKMIKAIKYKQITFSEILYTNTITFVYMIAKPYMIHALPLLLISALGTITILCSYLLDSKYEYILNNKKSLLALLSIVLGMILAVFYKSQS